MNHDKNWHYNCIKANGKVLRSESCYVIGCPIFTHFLFGSDNPLSRENETENRFWDTGLLKTAFHVLSDVFITQCKFQLRKVSVQ